MFAFCLSKTQISFYDGNQTAWPPLYFSSPRPRELSDISHKGDNMSDFSGGSWSVDHIWDTCLHLNRYTNFWVHLTESKSFLFPRLYRSAPTQVRRRPLSAVGYKRPISQYAQMAVATATGAPSRYQVSAWTFTGTVSESTAESEMWNSGLTHTYLHVYSHFLSGMWWWL